MVFKWQATKIYGRRVFLYRCHRNYIKWGKKLALKMQSSMKWKKKNSSFGDFVYLRMRNNVILCQLGFTILKGLLRVILFYFNSVYACVFAQAHAYICTYVYAACVYLALNRLSFHYFPSHNTFASIILQLFSRWFSVFYYIIINT